MIVQLNPPLPMKTPKGSGWAHFIIDYGPEASLLWVVFMDADGACWTVPNEEVRMTSNWTLGRRPPNETDRASGSESVVPAAATQRFRPTIAAGAET